MSTWVHFVTPLTLVTFKIFALPDSNGLMAIGANAISQTDAGAFMATGAASLALTVRLTIGAVIHGSSSSSTSSVCWVSSRLSCSPIGGQSFFRHGPRCARMRRPHGKSENSDSCSKYHLGCDNLRALHYVSAFCQPKVGSGYFLAWMAPRAKVIETPVFSTLHGLSGCSPLNPACSHLSCSNHPLP